MLCCSQIHLSCIEPAAADGEMCGGGGSGNWLEHLSNFNPNSLSAFAQLETNKSSVTPQESSDETQKAN